MVPGVENSASAWQAKFKAPGEAQARTTSPFINPEAFSYQGSGNIISRHTELVFWGDQQGDSAQGPRPCSKRWLNCPRRDHPKSRASRLPGTPPPQPYHFAARRSRARERPAPRSSPGRLGRAAAPWPP